MLLLYRLRACPLGDESCLVCRVLVVPLTCRMFSCTVYVLSASVYRFRAGCLLYYLLLFLYRVRAEYILVPFTCRVCLTPFSCRVLGIPFARRSNAFLYRLRAGSFLVPFTCRMYCWTACVPSALWYRLHVKRGPRTRGRPVLRPVGVFNLYSD